MVIVRVILFIISIILLILLLKGKGRPIKLLDENNEPYKNSISTREKILINGVE